MFKSARIKLTAWYLLVIMVVSICFSVAVFKIVSGEVERFSNLQRIRYERDLNQFSDDRRLRISNVFQAHPELILEMKNRLVIVLLLINALIFIGAGALGYFLAGRTLRPIQTMVEEQNRFISDASHEFRTPLTALKSSMEVFLRDKGAKMDDAKQLVKDSIGDVDKLTDLSASLLQLAQYEKLNDDTKFEDLSLAELMKESIMRVTPLAAEKKININNSLSDVTIKGSKYSLMDLFVILLENAVKYSDSKSSIDVSSVVVGETVSIIIKDYGEGMDALDIPHIFDRFYRADKSRSKTAVSGYGLGLSIAKRIVDLHKGEIFVESKLGEGSTFTIILPTIKLPFE